MVLRDTYHISRSAAGGAQGDRIMTQEHVADRFLRYVAIDTQSDEESSAAPSTQKQFDLAKMLVEELKAIGAQDVDVDEHCVVMASLPGNLDDKQDVPTVGFIAHLDTAPAVTGKDVKAQRFIYAGGDIVLPGDESVVISTADNPLLKKYKGKEIITTDGTTLLGADDKAGIAAIMYAVERMHKDPSIKHGPLRIAFTPDEEVGRGSENFDIEKFGAKLAYTIDGGEAGEVENETFCADLATIIIKGQNQHPGYAKDIMVNAVRIGADFIARLPKDAAPETTDARQPYLHPDSMSGNVEEVRIKCLVRAFTVDELQGLESQLADIKAELLDKYPRGDIDIQITQQYRNMRYHLDEAPRVTEAAIEAIERIGIKPLLKSIRGGTDGARLSELGVPTPNLFAGGHNFHSKLEFIPIQAMEKATLTVLHLCRLWALEG